VEPVVVAHSDPPRFEPPEYDAKVADTVEFRVASGSHEIQFDSMPGLSNENSGPLGRQTVFAVRFSQAGEFAYRCLVHEGMAGVIRVT
jgi:plastocyanin